MRKMYFIIFTLLPALTFAQFLNNDDFHSDLEKYAFEHLFSNKPVSPGLFLITSEADKGLDDYQSMALFIQNAENEFSTEEYTKLNSEKKLKKIFRVSQKQYFKKYELYKPLSAFIENGTYNCISGTAYFAILLNNLGYAVKVYETPHHAFLEVTDDKEEKFIIESTDPAFGFISDSKKIEARKREFIESQETFSQEGVGSDNLSQSNGFLNEINLRQLAGLQYYNLAIESFNKGDYAGASKLLKKAGFLYPSERIVMLQMLSDRFAFNEN